MPRLRCPRCSSVVEVVAGAAPVCTSCGFGSQGAAAPVAAAPVAAAPPLAALAPAAAPASRRGAIVAICIVGVLVLAGAAAAVAYFALRGEAPRALTEEEARTRVAASLQAVGDAMTGQAQDDDLRKVTIVTESQGAPSGPEDFFGGMGDMTATIEYGKGDRVRFDLHMARGAVTVAFTMICTPERQYMIAGGETYASRPAVVPATDEEGDAMCQDLDEGGLNETMPALEALEAGETVITRNGDGSLHAVGEDLEEGHIEMDIDAKGRVRKVTATPPAGEDPDMTMAMTFEYGERSSIETPEDFQLMPASVEFEQDRDNGEQTWTVVASREEPPLGDFEVRVQDYGTSSYDEGAAMEPGQAIFGMEDSSLQTAGNITFRFTDADGDGKLSSGDSFVVRDSTAGTSGSGGQAPAADPCNDPASCDPACDPDRRCWAEFGDFDAPSYSIVVYDRVAKGDVNSGFSEMPSPAWLALAALAFAGLASRRQH
ncbi:MAG TPA: hypothetical protein VM327_09430 [Candidatus Thermoplasmatota archaeon]|nr:hypothetical protein [Candidatus Thermoplasmatota archaeon]